MHTKTFARTIIQILLPADLLLISGRVGDPSVMLYCQNGVTTEKKEWESVGRSDIVFVLMVAVPP